MKILKNYSLNAIKNENKNDTGDKMIPGISIMTLGYESGDQMGSGYKKQMSKISCFCLFKCRGQTMANTKLNHIK
jgi:hypothetical protein